MELDFFFTQEHERLAERLAAFTAEEIAPLSARDEIAPEETFRRYLAALAGADLLRAIVAAPEGGPPSLRAICLIREALAYASPLADLAFIMQGLGTYAVARAGAPELRREVLERAARGELIAAFALTEPGAGSDVSAIKTLAEREGDFYKISGEKIFISNAPIADGFVLVASTNPAARGKGLSAFFIPAKAEGLSVEALELISPHPIGRVLLEGVRVPLTARLGEEGEGMRLALSTLDFFRTSVGAAAAGMARRALDEALAHVKRRAQFGKPLAEQQAVQFKLAEMATELEASRLLVYRAAYEKDRQKPDATREVAMAKLYATEAAFRVIDQAVQLHGGSGLIKSSIPERLYRDIRALRIYEGTSEIQHLVIANKLLK